jgi:nucleoside-diphosphate-sugar epimerase
LGNPEKPADYVYTKKDWSPETACAPYEKSKLKAEQAAWDFIKKLDDGKRFELAVVNPAYVQGPLLSASSGSGEGSKEFCDRLLSKKMPALPDLSFPIVDVRDVAASHIAARVRQPGIDTS